MRKNTIAYLEDQVVQTEDCWFFKDRPRNKYHLINLDRKQIYAHRLFYEVSEGEKIPKNIVIHHLCGNKACVNPRHMQPMKQSDHVKIHKPWLYKQANVN